METNHLHVRQFNAEYLVSAQHPAPERLKSKLDEALTQHLAVTLSAAFSHWFSAADPSVWLIRHLQVELAVNADWQPEQISRTVVTQIARVLAATLDSPEENNVLHFRDPGDYLAHFLTDAAAGIAWSQWYYESFAGLRLLTASAAMRTAICDQLEIGRAALLQLGNRELRRVLSSFTRHDAGLILDQLADSAASAGDFQCCQAIWKAWPALGSSWLNIADEPQQALRLYIEVNREAADMGGATLKRAAFALLRLARRLVGDSAEQNRPLLAALMGQDPAALYQAAGISDAEKLLPFLQCPPAWVHEVAQAIVARDDSSAAQKSAGTPDDRATAFGGAFLLLPLLDDLPLVEATRGWPHADEAAAITLVRFLLLVKGLGQERARRAFYDPLLRDLLLIPAAISPAILREWQARITPANMRNFVGVLRHWQSSRGAVAGETQVLARSRWRGRPVAVLIDGARGLWVLARRYSPRRPARLLETLRSPLAQLEEADGLLLCESSLLAQLWAEFPALKLVSLADGVAQSAPDQENPMSGILARLEMLTQDLSYLELPDSLGIRPTLDLTLSVAAQHVLRALAWRLPGFAWSNLPYLWRNFMDFAGSLEEEPTRRVVRLGQPPLHLVLSLTGMLRQSYHLSWLDQRALALFQET